MGESLIGRPIGPSYVPGTLKGQSSANAPALLQPNALATPPQAPPQTAPMPEQQLPNPAQDQRSKFWRGAAQAAPDKVMRMPNPLSSIGGSTKLPPPPVTWKGY